MRDLLSQAALILKNSRLKAGAFGHLDYESIWMFGSQGFEEYQNLEAGELKAIYLRWDGVQQPGPCGCGLGQPAAGEQDHLFGGGACGGERAGETSALGHIKFTIPRGLSSQ